MCTFKPGLPVWMDSHPHVTAPSLAAMLPCNWGCCSVCALPSYSTSNTLILPRVAVFTSGRCEAFYRELVLFGQGAF